MDYQILYVLTVRCDAKKCEEDLACYKIKKVDDEAVYFENKKISRDSLMEIEVVNSWYDEKIIRVPFLIKEAAIIWVRECFMYILKKGTPEMKIATRREWQEILNPDYDCFWFTGGQKAEQWLIEMKRIISEL